MGRVAVVITFDDPEDSSLMPMVEQIMSQLKTGFEIHKNTRAWIGIRESAEAIMQVTGESDG